jgi:hypothetical protein
MDDDGEVYREQCFFGNRGAFDRKLFSVFHNSCRPLISSDTLRQTKTAPLHRIKQQNLSLTPTGLETETVRLTDVSHNYFEFNNEEDN